MNDGKPHICNNAKTPTYDNAGNPRTDIVGADLVSARARESSKTPEQLDASTTLCGQTQGLPLQYHHTNSDISRQAGTCDASETVGAGSSRPQDPTMHNHETFMQEALQQAKHAYNLNEVPIGCIVTRHGKIIARAANLRSTNKNALHHAEILAINQACQVIGDWRLEDCQLYVTIEPCPMCAGAIVQARIPLVVYGAKNPKAGAAGSILNILDEPRLNHQVQVIPGICEEECAKLMRDFFRRFR